jgi:hypothetical protein
MSMRDVCANLTICEVLRQINDKVQDDNQGDIRNLLATAEYMAKRMATKLKEYYDEYDKDWYSNNPIYNHEPKRNAGGYKVGEVKL